MERLQQSKRNISDFFSGMANIGMSHCLEVISLINPSMEKYAIGYLATALNNKASSVGASVAICAEIGACAYVILNYLR
jgi:hypothetical protein